MTKMQTDRQTDRQTDGFRLYIVDNLHDQGTAVNKVVVMASPNGLVRSKDAILQICY